MLPRVATQDAWKAIVGNEAVLRPGVEDLCARLGLGGMPLTRFPDGSQPVYAVGDAHVLKLFPELAARDGVAEGRVLSYLHGRLPVATPEVREHGGHENGWHYVLMSRLPGEHLRSAWDRIPPAHRERIVAEIGDALAALHSLDPAPLDDVLGPGDWGAFLDRQRDGCVARQRARGLPAEWLEQIPGFLASVPLSPAPRRCLLHTEVMQEHILVDPDGWRVAGLFDFEPAMIGDRAYEFASVGLFVTRGDPALLSRLTRAYGQSFAPAELLAYALLHVYSNLPWYLRELPAPAEPTLAALAEAWFAAA